MTSEAYRFGQEEFCFDEPIPKHLMPAIRKLCALGDLQANWDLYGAQAIDPAIARAAIDFLIDQVPPEIPLPTVVPTSKGGIQLEWHCNGVDLEIELREPARLHVSFDDLKAGREKASLLLGGLEPLRPMLQQLNWNRLASECAKLDPKSERAMAEEGLALDLAHWPKY